MATHDATTTTLPLRDLGTGGLAVPAIGLGCMGMTGFYGARDEREALRTLERAIDLGATFWDTAAAYGPHINEELLARVLTRHRAKVVVATKFGVTIDPATGRRSVDGSPATARRSCEASLRRLGTDHLDLYYPHRVDPAVPIEETVGAVAELVAEGKVRHLGLSEPGPDTIRRAHRVTPVAAVQIEYSLWTRDVAAAVLPVVRELGIGLVAYAPLGHGLLTGRYRSPDELPAADFRRSQPRYSAENFAANLRLADRLRELASSCGATPTQLAIAWLLHQGDDIVPLVGCTRVADLRENLAAIGLSLSSAQLAELVDTLPDAAGERYDAGGMRTVGL